MWSGCVTVNVDVRPGNVHPFQSKSRTIFQDVLQLRILILRTRKSMVIKRCRDRVRLHKANATTLSCPETCLNSVLMFIGLQCVGDAISWLSGSASLLHPPQYPINKVMYRLNLYIVLFTSVFKNNWDALPKIKCCTRHVSHTETTAIFKSHSVVK